MGYHTEFEGSFAVTPVLAPGHRIYLKQFAATRRMQRDIIKAAELPDPIRKVVGLPIGDEGGYFVGAKGFHGQDQDEAITEYNNPPIGQPGLWCQWTADDEGLTIHWDGREKFYLYIKWLGYLIEHFLAPWGYKLDGTVRWRGEDFEDSGSIVVTDNEVVATGQDASKVYTIPPPVKG